MRPVRLATARPQKYHATPIVVQGVRFASKREARRHGELLLMALAGLIRDLERQPEFPIYVAGLLPSPRCGETPGVRADLQLVKVGRYTADFAYTDVATGECIVEDVKSTATRTTAYRLRKRLVEATYGIQIREV